MPSMRTVRTTPPAPGSRPRVTSGKPNCDFGLSSAMRRWQASAISRPPPSAAPFSAATTGLPSVSRRRRSDLILVTPCANSAAFSSVTWMSRLRSPPAKNVSFADVTMTPVIESFSASSRSIVDDSDERKASFIVLARWFGSSSVRVTMPSASWSQRIVSAHADALHDRRHAHAAADAQRREAVAQVACLELVDQRAEDHRAGGAQRVAQRDRAAVHVDLLVRDAQVLHELEHDGGERLVDLEQVDVVERSGRPWPAPSARTASGR